MVLLKFPVMVVDKVFYVIKILVFDKRVTVVKVEIDTGKQYALGFVVPDNNNLMDRYNKVTVRV